MQPLNLESVPPDERRAHPRKPCSYKCKIARYKRDVDLLELEFEPARLIDISAGGFSFSSARWPRHAELAFLLTDHPEAGVYLAHVRSIQHGKGSFIVRCQFIRVLTSAASPLAGRATRR